MDVRESEWQSTPWQEYGNGDTDYSDAYGDFYVGTGTVFSFTNSSGINKIVVIYVSVSIDGGAWEEFGYDWFAEILDGTTRTYYPSYRASFGSSYAGHTLQFKWRMDVGGGVYDEITTNTINLSVPPTPTPTPTYTPTPTPTSIPLSRFAVKMSGGIFRMVIFTD